MKPVSRRMSTLKACRLRSSAPGGWADSSAAAMPPKRVRLPVAVTSITAVPRTSAVPPKKALKASAGVAAVHGPGRLSTGKASPVSKASLVCAPVASSTMPSAGTRSPAASSTTSPGTSSSTGVSTTRPSRLTAA